MLLQSALQGLPIGGLLGSQSTATQSQPIFDDKLGKILGLAGTAAGFALGGPTGAKIGQQAGSALGGGAGGGVPQGQGLDALAFG